MTRPLLRVLVTGAGGFVGRHIVGALLAHDCDVIALDRAFDADLTGVWGDKVTRIESDAADLPDVQVNAVIHAAAITASPEKLDLTPEAHLRANLDPALKVLEWAAGRKARVVLMSSSAVFNDGSPQGKSESHPITPTGTYGIAKAALEHIAQTWVDSYGRDVVCVRLSSIYGEGELVRSSRPVMSLVARYVEEALTRGEIGVDDPNFARDWTYAPDIGEAIYGLLQYERLQHSLYNLASEQVRTTLQIAEAIQKHLPNTQISIHGDERDVMRPIQRGYLLNPRLTDEIGFTAWTPFEDGIARVVADAQQRMELNS
ncbi:MAG: NAD(P)-dependent oxidoreductase [Chloroflexota bacterium]|nr:NAD(P)-dependent oxidoreductase [Chloroflexota bacterium]